jgi:hypothetical protein
MGRIPEPLPDLPDRATGLPEIQCGEDLGRVPPVALTPPRAANARGTIPAEALAR